MAIPIPRVFCFLLLACGVTASAGVTYQALDDTAVVVTGVRSDSSSTDSVVLTASYVTGGITYAGLYNGSLAAAPSAPSSAWNQLTPVFPGQTVSSATFYGPNTARFNPSIGAGNIIAVGSYKYAEGSSGPNFDHGMLYEGPVNGSGTWTQIDATPLLTVGETLLNTIAHSNMGDLVVGNYDTSLATGKAFIYNRITDEWRNLNPGNTASVTAYGIWQNGGGTSTRYTIAGGQSDLSTAGLDESYLVDYDSATGLLTNFRVYRFNNQPLASAISHFDGITGTANGYNLTGDTTTNGGVRGFFASVPRNPNGTFGEATWTAIEYESGGVVADGTSGNTVVENFVLGIFVNGGATQSYLATVNPIAGATMTVAKNRTKATFTITNTGDTNDTFSLRRTINVSNDARGPGPAQPTGRPFSITFKSGGTNLTRALPAGTATTGILAPGQSVSVVQRIKVSRSFDYRRKIRTTLTATSQNVPTTAVSARAKVTMQPR